MANVAIQVTADTPVKRMPPAYGEPQRDAVKAIVDDLASQMAEKITEVRRRADQLEGMMLESTAHAKVTLDETISTLQTVGTECARLSEILDAAMVGQRDHRKRLNGAESG